MKKREIRKLASELYKEGKTRQETFDILIKKVKKPITYTADVLKYFPPLSTRKKFKNIYWSLLSLIIISEILIIISKIPFFYKSNLIIDFLNSGLESFTSNSILTFILLVCIPFLSWISAVITIILNHIKYNLNYLYLIIPYYITSVFFGLFPFIRMVFFGMPFSTLRYGEKEYWGTDWYEVEHKGIDTYIFYLSLYLMTITILLLCFILKKKMAPKYQKKQIAYLDKSGKKRMKLLIKFND
ncbi:MAG: hypothetical protein ACJ0QL_07560 [Parvicellaceae bacterium]